MTQTPGPSRLRNKVSAWHLLLLIPYVAVLWVPFFNSVEPTLLGFPYFYVYQIAWVVITSILTAIVYYATRRSAPRRSESR